MRSVSTTGCNALDPETARILGGGTFSIVAIDLGYAEKLTQAAS